MEGNVCDFNHLDEGVLVPPRKRLLAGFKKQNSNDQSRASTSASPPSTPTEVDTRVKNLLSSHSSGSSSSSIEDIVESSKKAALAAAKLAEAARDVAEEKAAIAAMAIAAAKTALELVATFSEETSGRVRRTKKNKSKKQVTVHSLYKKCDEVEDEETDEEIAQNLHQANYSSSKLSKQPSLSSNSKSLNHKRLKISPVTGKTKPLNGGILERDSRAILDGNNLLDTEGSSHEVSTLENEKSSQCLTKLISSNWRMGKDIVTQKRKARKLIRIVEGQVELS
ncbi:unnamed protein product [Rhodiola kirilowii]